MAFTVVFDEGDLRRMPSELRERVLKWYFDESGLKTGTEPPRTSALLDALSPISVVPRRKEAGRISFREFTRAGLLAPGDEVLCKALKRQKRDGGEPYLEAGKVSEDGYVQFQDRRYDVPSDLAVTVVNANGGKTKALNGYDYLVIRHGKRLVPLHELRDRFLKLST